MCVTPFDVDAAYVQQSAVDAPLGGDGGTREYRVLVVDPGTGTLRLGADFEPAGVDEERDTITFTAPHLLETGDTVLLGLVAGTTVPGLAGGTAYRVLKVDDLTIKLQTLTWNEPAPTPLTPGAVSGASITLPGHGFAEGQAVTYRFLAARSGLSVAANVGSLRFDPRLGTATPAGTLRVASTSGEAVHHVVNLAGRVRSCSPQAAVPGFQAC